MKDKQIVKSPDTEKKDRLPPGQKISEKWPVLHHGKVPDIDTSEWVFTISGMVKEERRIEYQEFMSLPRVTVLSDIHCVTGWTMLNNLWEGVSTSLVEKLSHILPESRFVIVHSLGGFTTNLSLSDFFESDVLFAIKHNNKLITLEHGHPIRLVVPRLYFWKSAKWVVGIEFTKEDRKGFWESRGYHNRGDPWKEERYSR